jgi:hypothetical protein
MPGIPDCKQINSSGNEPVDINKIRKICGGDMASKLISTMTRRDPKLKLEWEWKDLKKPKLVSLLSHTIIEGQPESRFIQAVIRINGQEVFPLSMGLIKTLTSGDSPPKSKETWTYVIMQYKMWVRGNWFVFCKGVNYRILIGRTQETHIDKVVLIARSASAVAKMKKKLRASLGSRVRKMWDSIRYRFT